MSNLLSMMTSKELMIVYMVIGIAVVLCIMIYLVEKSKTKRRLRHNTRELNKLVEKVKEEIPKKKEEVYYEEPVMQVIPDQKETSSVTELIDNTIIPTTEPTIQIEKVEEIKEETTEPVIIEEMALAPEVDNELEYTTIEPDQKTAQLELKKLTEELKKEETLEETQNISLTNYEEEQEETAIISLDELVKMGKEMYESNEMTQYSDENTVPISLSELEQQVGKKAEKVDAEPFIIANVVPEDEEEVVVIEEKPQSVETPKVETTKKVWKTSPIISPIYGIERQVDSNELALENTADYAKLDATLNGSNEFLMTLQELQNKLD